MQTSDPRSICSYSILSLHLYFLLPTNMLGHLIGLNGFISMLLAIFLPPLILKYIVGLFKDKYVILTDHTTPSHPHDCRTTFSVFWRSTVLGLLFTMGLRLITSSHHHDCAFGYYLILLSFFHFSEFLVTSLTNPDTLNPSSFLIEQSTAYMAAMIASILEFSIEAALFPNSKTYTVISLIGLYLAIIGESIRKLAILTAGENFTHLISTTKKSNHSLVQHGIYSVFRHPSYAGWFYWALGTQILLLNPICCIIFTIASIKFFKSRIEFEEKTLIEFFGDEYRKYQSRVGIWIPI